MNKSNGSPTFTEHKYTESHGFIKEVPEYDELNSNQLAPFNSWKQHYRNSWYGDYCLYDEFTFCSYEYDFIYCLNELYTCYFYDRPP